MRHFVRLIRTQWDRAGAVALVGGGLLTLLAGWIGMSGAVLTYEQLPYVLSGGLFGLALITVGTGLWLSADIRDEWRRIDRLEETLEAGRARASDQDIRIPEEAAPVPETRQPPQSVTSRAAAPVGRVMKSSAPMLPVRGMRACLALGALGWVAMGVGWYQAAGHLRVEDQMDGAVLSVAGTTVVGLVTVLLVLVGRRAVEARLHAVLTRAEQVGGAATGAVVEAGGLVATDGMARYHRPSCRLAQGKPVRRQEWAVHEAAGRRPCGVCRP